MVDARHQTSVELRYEFGVENGMVTSYVGSTTSLGAQHAFPPSLAYCNHYNFWQLVTDRSLQLSPNDLSFLGCDVNSLYLEAT